MSINKSFLEPETRLGFYIPSSIKQAWAAELEVLQAIDELCSKYGIKYFADWGTLLGTVRHGGFIPWDDDLDIAMIREDYDRFIEVASELPKGYTVHTFRNEEGYREFHAVVQNSEHACFEAEHMRKFHGFPYIAGIDIFLLDYVYPDEDKEIDRVERIKYVIAIADGLLDDSLDEKVIEQGLKTIEDRYKLTIDRKLPKKELWIKLYELAEQICAEVKPQEADELTQIIPWGVLLQKDRRYSKKNYEEIIRLPFENTTMPVPATYDDMLSRRYGNYCNLVKNGVAGHDYPFFKAQKKSLQALMDFELPSFKWSDEKEAACNRKDSSNTNTGYKAILKEALAELDSIQNAINDEAAASLCDSMNENISSAQQLAIDIGGFIEKIKGEGHISIASLEAYCEALYSLYEVVTNDKDTGLLEVGLEKVVRAYELMTKQIDISINKRREVVFLPYIESGFEAMRKLYDEEVACGNADVYVVPIPYFYKDYDGQLIDGVYDTQGYPEDINIYPYEEFSLELHNPEVIYHQNAYDQYNDTISVHPDFYSSILCHQTSKLVYIPSVNVLPFDENDEKSYQNMDEYVTAPGAVYADQVIVPDEVTRAWYIKKLTEWAVEDTEYIWEKKIVNYPSSDKAILYLKKDNTKINNDEPKHKKTLMYFIGEGLPIQHSDSFIEKLTKNIEVFRENKSKVHILLVYNKTLIDNLCEFRPKLAKAFETVLAELASDATIDICRLDSGYKEELVNKCDAYYGDAGPFVPVFVTNKKPVMLQNWEIT